MKKSILKLIREVVEQFYNDWSMGDEPSLADKYYEKQGITGQSSQQQPQQQNPINAELVGYVDKQWQNPITPIPVYKNPKTLDGFTKEARGILLNTGDLYLAQSYNALHDNILKLLADKGIVKLGATYGYEQNYPAAFVAVQRAFTTTTFGQSMAYDEFPPHYQEIFDIANQKQPFKFKEIPL